MDPDIEIMHVVKVGQLIPSSLVTVHLSQDYNRKAPNFCSTMSEGRTKNKQSELTVVPKCDSDTSDICCDPVDLIWQERQLQNPRLFNGTKFRIHNVTSSEDNEKHVVMFLGVTDYKEYLGTNWAPNVKVLQKKGIELHQNSQAFLSDALGVGASVVTKDNCIVLLRRSEHCAEAPDMWDVPGGHAEPKKIVGDKQLKEIDVTSMNESAVIDEIFDSIVQEVTDEVNIPLAHLGVPLYMGTHRNTTSAGRPSLAFEIRSTRNIFKSLTGPRSIQPKEVDKGGKRDAVHNIHRCSLSSEDIRTLYNQGNQQEADESTNITFVSLNEIADLATQKQDLWGKMAPSAKGNLTVFSLSHGLQKL